MCVCDFLRLSKPVTFILNLDANAISICITCWFLASRTVLSEHSNSVVGIGFPVALEILWISSSVRPSISHMAEAS